MSSFWTGERVRLRGIEPEDWRAFMRIDAHSDHQRSADALFPPRSAEGYRAWVREKAVAESEGDCFRLAIESLDGGELVGSLVTFDADPSTASSASSRRAGCASTRSSTAVTTTS
jgi:hypothetical protein